MAEVILYLDAFTERIGEVIKELAPKNFDIRFARPDGELDFGIYDLDVRYFMVASAPVPRGLMERFKHLKLIQKTGAGTENIDIEGASSLGIPVATTPGVNSSAVAEMVILYILVLYRKLIELDRETKQGRWLMWERRHQCFELKGKEVGLVGFGNIGRAVNQRLQSFEANVSYFDVKTLSVEEEKVFNIQRKTMEEILTTSDVISLHLPLNEHTRNFIGEKELSVIKPNSILINTSRGAIINESALVKALEAKKLAGAALDTYVKEPVSPDNPLLKFSNVITTPHVGAGTIDTVKTVLLCAFSNIDRASKGLELHNVINKTAV